jgi:hypothetical protein
MISSRFIRPTPCSALIDPCSSRTTPWTMSLNSCQRARLASVSARSGWVGLKWMLPSPTWPKAIGRMPGSVSVTPAVARMMNSAARLTGTETSSLIEPE